MKLPATGVTIATVFALGMTLAPAGATGNALVIDYYRFNEEGALSHVVPRSTAAVRMVAERVVLVPYWDPKTKRAQVLVHVWYDLLSQRGSPGLSVGFPEVKGIYRHFLGDAKEGTGVLRLRQPTIWRFSARVGGRRLPVTEHPGVARYRRWFTFKVPMPARRKVRLHTLYLARLGRAFQAYQSTEGMLRKRPNSLTTTYWIDYVLHTGGFWKGKIGKGAVEIFAGGRHHPLKRYRNLNPTLKDDVTIKLALGPRLSAKERETMFDGLLRGGSGQESVLLKYLRRLNKLPLVQQSSQLPSTEVAGLGALAVDGDSATGWISAPRKGVGAWLQLPADPRRTLRRIRVLGLARTGVSRPARLEVRCQRRRRGAITSRKVAAITVPRSAGPHDLRLPATKGCEAIRLVVKAVHGSAAAPVGLAEVSQHYTTRPTGAPKVLKVQKCCLRLTKKPRRALLQLKQLIAKLPRKHLQWGWEKTQVSNVRWSADGTVVHFVLWQENEHYNPRGVLMGYFLEVATGKVLQRYRVDRVGTLPALETRQWRRALPYDTAATLLKRYGFRATPARRVAPRAATVRPVLRLRTAVTRRAGRLRVRNKKTGYRWWYEVNPRSRLKTPVSGSLELVGRSKARQRRALGKHRLAFGYALARRHLLTRAKRRSAFYTEVRAAWPGVYASGKVSNRTLALMYYRVFPQVHAYSGEVRLFWHPRGHAVLTVWRDSRYLTSLLPDRILKKRMAISPGTWSRRDYGRSTAKVRVFALAPTKRTTLAFTRSAVQSRSTATAKAPRRTVGTARPARAMAPARARAAHRARPAGPRAKPLTTRPSTGCGCRATTAAPRIPFMLVLLSLLIWLRRRSSRAVIASGSRRRR